MGKDEGTSQLNLTVVALVALVAIVGLVALVLNAASIIKAPAFATGSQLASAAPSPAEIAETQAETNIAGSAVHSCQELRYRVTAGNDDVSTRAAARLLSWGACN